jgi:hypothetical protein
LHREKKEMKRNNTIRRLIEETNAYLRYKKITSVNNDLFYSTAAFLMTQKQYKGFRCFVDIKNEKTGLTHAVEKMRTEKFDYIQFV